ncbi:hypothetical protein ACFVW1_15465 [Streptomyces olivochromogenes]|uniref:hypothetical protein n=1 Tax=Streptomyces olivochromogenes TaxID=1963 RepID=UPI0036DD1712
MIWRREPGSDGGTVPSGGGDRSSPADTDRTLTVPHLRGAHVHTTVLHPATAGAAAEGDAADGKLTVSLPRANTAVLLRLSTVSHE